MLAGGATFTRGAKVRGWLRLVLRCDHRTMRGMSPRIQMRIVIITRVSKSFKPSAGARRKRGHGGTAAMPLHGVESSSLHGFKPSSRSSANPAGNRTQPAYRAASRVVCCTGGSAESEDEQACSAAIAFRATASVSWHTSGRTECGQPPFASIRASASRTLPSAASGEPASLTRWAMSNALPEGSST